ncbi:HNH endonuclease [Christensenella intestinihominis]|uniref:HNH endonuclease n=1 Tax=Christensenella intestinihominis TaxID=1851429 RepID=UPI0008300977|nr:HNH endonuclease [Christensenella intestinihominis]
MNKAIISEDVLREKYIRDGKPMNIIARELGVAVGSVYNYVKRYGIESRPTHMGFKGKTHSEEARRKISNVHKGKVLSDETKRKIAESHSKHFDGVYKEGHKKEHYAGYILVYAPDHPRATKDGYVFEHRIVMERLIGRFLNESEVVHHINHNRSDNRIENLKLMKRSDHCSFHMKLRALERNLLDEYQ